VTASPPERLTPPITLHTAEPTAQALPVSDHRIRKTDGYDYGQVNVA